MTMTPKEKCDELIGKYAFHTISDFSDENFEQTRSCALVCVDEIILAEARHLNGSVEYWKEVKEEIIKYGK